uniref:Uncharacterized protein n=1 Tax=Picea sitchensis TaxID=3332 RepID=A9NYG6_PICSI|nr:unknown [Picea sitchensis]
MKCGASGKRNWNLRNVCIVINIHLNITEAPNLKAQGIILRMGVIQNMYHTEVPRRLRAMEMRSVAQKMLIHPKCQSFLENIHTIQPRERKYIGMKWIL